MQLFRTFIENYTPISDQDWNIISACFEKITLEKGDIFLK